METKTMEAYLLGREFPLIPSPKDRPWMDATPSRYAYRCLPLLIANQNGWLVCTPEDVEAVWDGGNSPAALDIRCEGEVALSHFGFGILTWRVPYLFRTPPGFNLYVHGPPNYPKAGLSPLEGIVETDWAVASFTFNWQLTDPGRTVGWRAGEPVCMVTPLRRGEVEEFEPAIKSLDDNPDLKAQYETWQESRDTFLQQPPETWQRDYMLGTSPGGPKAPAHQTKLAVKEPLNG
jgi:hypothetical protein